MADMKRNHSLGRRAALVLAAAATLAGVYALPPAPVSHQTPGGGPGIVAER
jgi:hypothetical protein